MKCVGIFFVIVAACVAKSETFFILVLKLHSFDFLVNLDAALFCYSCENRDQQHCVPADFLPTEVVIYSYRATYFFYLFLLCFVGLPLP